MASKPRLEACSARSLMRPSPSSRLNSECRCRWTKSLGATVTAGQWYPGRWLRTAGPAGGNGRDRLRFRQASSASVQSIPHDVDPPSTAAAASRMCGCRSGSGAPRGPPPVRTPPGRGPVGAFCRRLQPLLQRNAGPNSFRLARAAFGRCLTDRPSPGHDHAGVRDHWGDHGPSSRTDLEGHPGGRSDPRRPGGASGAELSRRARRRRGSRRVGP